MKYLILSLLPVAFWFGLWIGRARCNKENKSVQRRRSGNQRLVELVRSRLILAEIHEGRTEAALELLEYSIDTLAPTLWRQDGEAGAQIAGPALKALRDLKSYRRRWPRKPKPELISSEELLPKDVREAADDTENILSNLPPELHECHPS